MKKLVLCHPYLYTKGGAERVVLKIAQHYDAPIYCSIYSPETTYPEFKELDVRVINPKKPKLSFLPIGIRNSVLSGIDYYSLKLDDFDVINLHGNPSEWARQNNSPALWYCYSPNRGSYDLYDWKMSKRNIFQKALYWPFIQTYKTIENSIVPKIEKILTISEISQSRIKKYLNRESEIIYPCIDAENFYCEDYQPYFFYPSRIAPEKRFEYVIDAFDKFKKANKSNKSWKLKITGFVDKTSKINLDYFETIKQMAETVGDVEFVLGANDTQLSSLYANCSAVLFSPINEDFGIIPLEAFASYKPCIAVNEGGPKEIITKETGFLVNSPQEMSEKMILLAENPSITEEMGKNARKRVEKYFNWNYFFEKFENAANSIKKKN